MSDRPPDPHRMIRTGSHPHNSKSVSEPATPGNGGDQWLLVAVAGLLGFVAMLDMSVVNIALPTITHALRTGPDLAQWAVLGYLLPVVGLVLPVGRWLDQVGRRPALMLAIGGFAAGAVASALAPDVFALIAARVCQGVFGAMLLALIPALAAGAVRPQARARAMSVLATLGPLGAACGPAVGGPLVDAFGWRAIFFIKIPICLAAMVIGWFTVARDGTLRAPDRQVLFEALLIAGAVTALLIGLSFGAAHGPSWFLLSIAAVPALVVWSRRPVGRATATLLRSGVAAPGAAVFLLAVAFAAMRYLLPFRLQGDMRVNATVTGLVMLAFPLGMVLLSPVGGWLADRFGTRRLGVLGAVVTGLGLALLIPLEPTWSPVDVAWRLALAGAGMGLHGGPVQALAMSAAPPGMTAATGGTVQLARNLGFALGPAAATVGWAAADYTTPGMRAALIGTAVTAVLGAAVLLFGRPVHGLGRPSRPSATTVPDPSPLLRRQS